MFGWVKDSALVMLHHFSNLGSAAARNAQGNQPSTILKIIGMSKSDLKMAFPFMIRFFNTSERVFI